MLPMPNSLHAMLRFSLPQISGKQINRAETDLANEFYLNLEKRALIVPPKKSKKKQETNGVKKVSKNEETFNRYCKSKSTDKWFKSKFQFYLDDIQKIWFLRRELLLQQDKIIHIKPTWAKWTRYNFMELKVATSQLFNIVKVQLSRFNHQSKLYKTIFTVLFACYAILFFYSLFS